MADTCGVGTPESLVLSQAVGYSLLGVCLVFFVALTLTILWVMENFSLTPPDDASYNTAGGAVPIGFSASSMVSQWTWAATLQQSCTFAFKYGVSGGFWYGFAVIVVMSIFSLCGVELRRKAPHFKTFLEVMRVRFGPRTHVLYTIIALCCNFLIASMLILGGSAALNEVTGASKVIVSLVMPLGYIPFCYIGGLRAKVVNGYFNTNVIMLILMVFSIYTYAGGNGGTSNDPLSSDSHPSTLTSIGSIGRMFELLQERKDYALQFANTSECRPQYPFLENRESNLLTFASPGALSVGLINIVGCFGVVFTDQAVWQDAIAAHPQKISKSFYMAILVWMAIPITLATSVGLAGQALGGLNITIAKAETGVVPVLVASRLLGNFGVGLFLVQVIVSVFSTGASEVSAISSLLTYDLYRAYFNINADAKQLKRFSQWNIIGIGLVMSISGAALSVTEISLSFVYLIMGILLGSAVGPLGLSLFWQSLSANNMFFSTFFGLFAGLFAWIFTAYAKFGMISIASLNHEFPMLLGNITALLSSFFLTLGWGLVFPHYFDFDILLGKPEDILQRMRAAEDPENKSCCEGTCFRSEQQYGTFVAPETEVEVPEKPVEPGEPAIPLDDMETEIVELDKSGHKSDPATKTAADEAVELEANYQYLTQTMKINVVVISVVVTGVILAIPVPLYVTGYVFSLPFFNFWIALSLFYAVACSAVIIIFPIVEERYAIYQLLTDLIHWKTNSGSSERN